MERTFFTLQNELLKPVFAIYPWSPELPSASVEDALDRSTLEQALFAKASQYRTVDREKVLRDLTPFLDGDERILEVLNRPDWDTLVPEDFLPEGMWQLLKNEGGKHTLNISTYPEKQRQTEADATGRPERCPRTLESLLWLCGHRICRMDDVSRSHNDLARSLRCPDGLHDSDRLNTSSNAERTGGCTQERGHEQCKADRHGPL